jgi:glycerol-3-phosphate dehydrogenase
MDVETQVVVVGGGATGTAVLRDLALRGIDAVLVERADLGTGTSGRWQGLLHSGGRYAVKDPVSATECIKENMDQLHLSRRPRATPEGGLHTANDGHRWLLAVGSWRATPGYLVLLRRARRLLPSCTSHPRSP